MEFAGVTPIPQDVQDRYVAEGLWDDARLRDGLEAQARRTPDRVAVSDATSSWTYAELDRAVGRALGCLQHRGIGAGSAVLVVAPLIAASVATYHAVLRSGAVVVMLDRRCGRADVATVLAAIRVDLVVSTPQLIDHLDLAALDVDVLSFDELLRWSEPSAGWSEPDPRRAIAVVFTSGTTNRPKSAVHSLHTLRSGARNMAEALELTERDVAFLSTPIASITGLVQTHLTLDRGAGLHLEDRFDAAGSLARLREHGATIYGGASVVIEELFTQALRQDLAELPIRAISLGGGMIPRSVLELGMTRYGIRPVRIYGSSEVPCATTTMPADEGETRVSNDGACAPGTEVRIAVEPPGEILVRGPMRFLGFLDEEHNREAFAEGGWYRTGDLGRFENGRLTVTGRLKETVSRKGLKISLSEIDEVARELPHAEEVAAFGVLDPETGEHLALAVHASDPEKIDFDSVVGWLLDSGLAKWKLPEQVDVWDRPLPRTASGKVQRRMIAAGAPSARTLLAPRLRG